MKSVKRKVAWALAFVMCTASLIQPVSAGTPETAGISGQMQEKTEEPSLAEKEISLSIKEGKGKIVLREGEEDSREVTEADTSPVTLSFSGESQVFVEIIPEEKYEIAFYRTLTDGGAEKENMVDTAVLNAEGTYTTEVSIKEISAIEAGFLKKEEGKEPVEDTTEETSQKTEDEPKEREDSAEAENFKEKTEETQTPSYDMAEVNRILEETGLDLTVTPPTEEENAACDAVFGDSAVNLFSAEEYDGIGAIGSTKEAGSLSTDYGWEHADINVFDYWDGYTQGWQMIDTWGRGVIGVKGGSNGIPAYCVEPGVHYERQDRMIHNALDYYSQDAVTELALACKYVEDISDAEFMSYANPDGSKSISQAYAGKYYVKQVIVWNIMEKYYPKYTGYHDIAFELSNTYIDQSFLGWAIPNALTYAKDNKNAYKGYGKILFNEGSTHQKVGVFKAEPLLGSIEIRKSSANPEFTDGSDCYSLAGAEYGVFKRGTDTKIAAIITDENGYGRADNIPKGDYDIKELKAPKGYALDDDTVGKITVNSNAVATYSHADKPQRDPVGILLGKIDAETNNNTPPESRHLENAEFTVKFYKGYYDVDPATLGKTVDRTWVLKTDEKGFCHLSNDSKISGDDFYYSSFGVPTLPLGTITIQETKAPKGYIKNPEIFVRRVPSDGSQMENVNTYNMPIIPEQVQKGIIRLRKEDAETGRTPSGTGTLQGAVYEVFDSAGTKVDTLTTNASGEAQSKQLPVDTYTVKEKTPSRGYILDKTTYTVAFEGDTLNTPLFYKDVVSKETPQKGVIRLTKQDKETSGQPAGDGTLQGAVYEIFNAKGTKVDTLTTNAQGKAQSKQLPLGTYTVKESSASVGYIKDPVTYTVTMSPDQSNQAVVYGDAGSKETPQKGIIRLEKLDKDTAAAQAQGTGSLQGAVYEIFNSSATKVDTLTTGTDGKAQSKELLLGTYTVKEKTPSTGYTLDPNTYTVKLTSENRTDRVFYKTTQSKEAVIRGGVAVEKWDNEKDKREPQGQADLQDAKIQIISKNPKPVVVAGKSYANGAVITTLTTDAAGKASTASNYLPYGDYQIKETVPPTGYNNTGTITRNFSIRENGKTVQMNTSGTAIKNNIIRGGVLVEKWDRETDERIPQGGASLQGAKIQIISKNPNTILVDGKTFKNGDVITTLVTDAEGKVSTTSNYLPYGAYQLKETVSPTGYNNTGVITRDFVIRKQGEVVKMNTTDTAIKNNVIRGGVAVEKWDSEKNKREPQGEADFKDTKIQIISKNKNAVLVGGKKYGNGDVITTLVTDIDGKASTSSNYLPYGDYQLKETVPPTGYNNTGTITRNFSIREHGKIVQMNTSSTAIKNDVIRGGVLVEKWDIETDERIPQGAASLEGAEIQIISKNPSTILVDGKLFKNGDVITTLVTDKDGKASTKTDYLPYGSYLLKETVPPEGYNNTGIISRSFSIRKQGEIVRMNTTDTAIKNDVIRGDVQIVKFGSSQESDDSDIKKPLKNIKFIFTSKTTGKKYTIITDENGYATTRQLGHPRGGLIYDTYVVTEESPYPDYGLIKPFEVTISEEQKTLYYIIENDVIEAPVSVVKKDASTGRVIPVKGTAFQILDENKNVIEMTVTHYPSLIVQDTWETDESGSFMLPEKLKVGTYYLKEVKAPQGYLKGELLEFKVDKGYQWDTPLTVEYEDTPVMGNIAIKKSDKVTGEKLAGAVFAIIAEEDIITADGTVRAVKDEVVDTITTDAEGKALSKNLYLGKYEVKEIKPAPGFVLSKKSYKAELKYKDQTTEIVTDTLEIQNKPTVIIIDKKVTGSEQRLSGVKFAVWNKAMTEEIDTGIAEKNIYTTVRNGEIRIERLLPGTYCIQEVEGLAGYAMDAAIHEFTIDEDGKVKGKGKAVITVENAKTEIVSTTAVSMDTGKHEAATKKDTVIRDTVRFKNLQPGAEIKVQGILMDKSTGEPLLIGEKQVTAETVFTAEAGEQEIENIFQLDASSLLGKEIVVFEKAFIGEIEIAAHEDINDKDQAVKFPVPEIGTTAKNEATGTQEAAPNKQTTIIDTVKYENVIPGQEYTVKGILMDKETGKELVIDGKPVTAEKTFTAEEKKGSVELAFTFDASGLTGKEIVVFERLYVEETEVAVHTDIKDKGQTIKFPVPKIGTTAKNEATGTQEAAPGSKTVIVDTVKYENVIPGQIYTVKGILMEKGTGKEFLVNGKSVTAEKTFTAEKKTGSVDVIFTFDASALNGKAIVVFEHLYVEETEVTAHADIKDKGQTIEFPVPKIGTTAKNEATGTQEAAPGTKTVIVDTVKYENVIPEQEYTVKGILMEKETGKEFLVNGKPVTAEKTFTAEKKTGSVDVTFTFDASALNGKSVVVFERLYVEETEVTAHADIKDKVQTIEFPVPKIGTTAKNEATQTQEAAPGTKTVIVDTVKYENVIPGQEYTVKGILMEKGTGKEFLVNGKPVTAEKTFTPKKKNGSVKLKFIFDASALTGKSVVVFERLYVEKTEVAAHTDIKDKGQTVEFPVPEIGTTARNEATGNQEAAADKKVTILDTVRYKNMIPGQEYIVKGILMDKGTGKELLVDGKAVTAEKTFTAREKEGSVELAFTFNASALTGKSVVVFERLYVEETEVAVHADMKDKDQTIEFPVPEIRTTAKDKTTGIQLGITKEKTVLVDTVFYKNVIPGQKYTVKGILMDKATGKELLIDGKPVTAEKTFIPAEKTGIVDLEFAFDSSALTGKAIVVFEHLYIKDTEVAAHADIEDKAQTVEFPQHKISTQARDKATGSQEAAAKNNTVIIDKVSYENVIPGQAYVLKGILMDKKTGEPLLVNVSSVTAEKTFTPAKASGSTELEFTFDATLVYGKEIVVFEHLYAQGAKVAEHADINDKGQTVGIKNIGTITTSMADKTRSGKAEYVKGNVKTGDDAPLVPLVMASITSVCAVAVMAKRRKKRRENEDEK